MAGLDAFPFVFGFSKRCHGNRLMVGKDRKSGRRKEDVTSSAAVYMRVCEENTTQRNEMSLQPTDYTSFKTMTLIYCFNMNICFSLQYSEDSSSLRIQIGVK